MQAIWRAFVFVWQHAKLWFALSLLIHLLSGLLPIAALWVTMELVNAVTQVITDGNAALDAALWLVGLQFLITVGSSLLRNLQDVVSERIKWKIEHDMQRLVAKKAASVPIAYFDIPDFYNHFQRIQGNIGQRFLAPMQHVLEAMQATIRVIGFWGFLFSIHWSLVAISVAASIPLMLVQVKFGQKRFLLLFRQTPVAREASYLAALLMDRQSIKEVRLFGLSDYLLGRWSQKFLQNALGYMKLFQKQKLAGTGLDALTGSFYAGSTAVLVVLAQGGKMQIGHFVATGQALSGAQMSVNSVAMNLASTYEESLFLQDLYRFFEYEVTELVQEKRGSLPFPKQMRAGIAADHVSFSYVGSEREVLQDISFEIKPGERVAIVGENGSGKTTLVKCLMGFYVPTKGAVLFDGVEAQQYAEEDLHRQMTVIFQDFMQYAFTVRENIALGDLDALDDEERLYRAAAESRVDEFVARFSEGYDTYLGRYLADGEDLSGGQWQKIALARALFRDGQILILDEPTAALDPLAEMEVFQQFDELTRGKTTIFISHRMAAARIADRILVMKEGRLIEAGTHEELMTLDGEYSRMYSMQAKWYTEESAKELAGR